MRVVAPTPESNVSTQIVDGYQLCARCGEVMVTDESVVVVPRLDSWLIYAHHVGPNCPAKAVRGWHATRSAEGVRKVPIKKVGVRESLTASPGLSGHAYAYSMISTSRPNSLSSSINLATRW
jgi:hypothetical protein